MPSDEISRREFLRKMACSSLAFFAMTKLNLKGLEPSASSPLPNILWLTIEDSSFYEYGCYGNKHVHTPNIDSLAKKGILFRNAWSTAPQCSPARSSLVTGCYATTYGMDIHRRRVKTPANIYFPALLRKAGYYCTNNAKLDYNTKDNAKVYWDESGPKASYNSPKRKAGQPFFAVYNSNATHMSRIRSMSIADRRDFSKEGLNPAELELPGHVPDLPEIRSDYAFHLEGVQDIDKWVGKMLQDIKDRQLDQDTIVFFFSDHGGCQPRGKGYLFESGLHVPMIIYIPPKWRHLFPAGLSKETDRLIGFVDIAPTMLSLAGITIPENMQGKAFLGSAATIPRKMQFSFRANGTEDFDPCRAVTDGRYKYIRSYAPHKPYCLRNFFQWGMPANLAWDKYVLSGNCKKPEWKQPFTAKPPEALFDLKTDPWELSNLSEDHKYQDKLIVLREAVSKHIRETRDLGFFPRSMHGNDVPLHEWVSKTSYPLKTLWESAETASTADPGNQDRLKSYLASEHPSIRYWGASGFATLGALGNLKKCPEELISAIKDSNEDVAAAAAEAVCHLGRVDIGLPALVHSFQEGSTQAYSCLETLTWYVKTAKALKQYVNIFRAMKNQKARSILVNLGEIPVKDLYDKTAHEKGKAVNKVRRSNGPNP